MGAIDLRKQFQQFRHRPEEGIQGDCYPTAIACVLGRPRADIPHWHEALTGPEVNARYIDWFRSQGLRRIYFPVLDTGETFRTLANEMWSRGDGMPMILTGAGPRGVNHVVVVYGTDDFWCPTLGKTNDVGLVGPALPDGYYWAEWIVREPSEAAP